MKKCTSLLLCLVLVLSLFSVNAAAAENTGIEARAAAAGDGTVTVVVSSTLPTANARLTVSFNSEQLTYTGDQTAFAVHAVRAEQEQLTIGLANASSAAVTGELVRIRFRLADGCTGTAITVKSGSETVTVPVEKTGPRFQDVPEGQWFYEAVERMAAEGYIKGISQTHFGPALNMNRASFVTLLGRLAGIPEIQEETQFTDVPVDSFCSGYVAWAVEKGITNGISETKFNPTGSVNRVQMVTFLYRYVVSEGIDVTVADPEAVLAQFPDASVLPDWAVAPFAWAVDRGIINGTDGKLAPAQPAKRAEVAVMLYRFLFEQ